MAKTRVRVDYLNGDSHQVPISAGAKITMQREGIEWGSDEFRETILWPAVKRNGLPHTEGEGDEGIMAWLDEVDDYDLVIPQEFIDELKAAGEADKAEELEPLVREESLGESSATPAP